MEFEEFSKQAIKQIDKQLSQLLAEWRKEVGKIDKKLLPLVDKFIDSCSGGKKLRGVLVVLGNKIATVRLGGPRNDDREIYKIAAAYEILHSAVLVHDDIIDQSPERRGQPSLYKAIGGGHYGVSQAVSLGDAGFFLGLKIISESKFSNRTHLGGVKAHLRGDPRIKAIQLFSKIMLDTALGEILDLEKADPLVVTKLKTAYYTISGPLQLGAILGESESHLGGVKAHLRGVKLIDNLAKFGENLGIAFQIKDDLLDGEEKIWGGAEKAGKEADMYKNKAMNVLPNITKDKKMSKLLEQMGEYLVQRTK